MNKEIPIDKIVPNEDNCRKKFDDESLGMMADSISKNTLLNPITVMPCGEKFKIITGERRWRAAKKAGLKTIECRIRENVSRSQMLIENFIENAHREDLDPWDKADGLEKLLKLITKSDSAFTILESMDYKDKRTWTDEEKRIGEEIKKLGISLDECVMTMGAVELPRDMQKELRDRRFAYARELVRIKDNELRHTVWKGIKANKKSISDTRRRVDEIVNSQNTTTKNIMVRRSEYMDFGEISPVVVISNLAESLLKKLNNFSMNSIQKKTEKDILKSNLEMVREKCESLLKSLE